jgi:hypothetical protein
MADPSTGKFVFTDGGTGIHDQLGEWLTKSGREVKDVPPMFFKKGLTVSNYDYTDDKGNVSEAHTYYLP